MRVAMLGAGESWMGAFCKRVMLQNFVDDLGINDIDNVRAALAPLVPDADAILTAAQGDENKLRLRTQTEEAQRRELFGAPTFMVCDEMFWGNDRMEEAITLAAELQQKSAMT